LLLVALAVATLAAAPRAARALHGVIEISQARALAGGVIPSDSPGFPVTLNRAGSYRLTTDLSTGSSGLTAIQVVPYEVGSAGGIHIDLNGFQIQCVGPASLCPVTAGPGIGIDATGRPDVSVVNGRIVGVAGGGIVAGERAHIEDVLVFNVGGTGISVSNDSAVVSCTSNGNGANGIVVGNRTLVMDSESRGNLFVGLDTGASCVIVRNRVSGSTGSTGLAAGQACVLARNAAIQNSSTGIACTGGGCVLRENVAQSNGGEGFLSFSGSALLDNVAAENGTSGAGGGFVLTRGELLLRNAARNNVGLGFDFLDFNSGYGQNVFTGNFGGGEQQGLAGTQLPSGSNFCGTNTSCP
jgi:hypothetical protein